MLKGGFIWIFCLFPHVLTVWQARNYVCVILSTPAAGRRWCFVHNTVSFDSKPSTVMDTRTHIKICDVEARFYMNILFVSACVDSVTGAKLCVSVFFSFWCGTPVRLCWQHLTTFLLTNCHGGAHPYKAMLGWGRMLYEYFVCVCLCCACDSREIM